MCSVRRWTIEDKSVDICNVSQEEPIPKTPLEQLLDYKNSKDVVENLNCDSESDLEREISIEEKISRDLELNW